VIEDDRITEIRNNAGSPGKDVLVIDGQGRFLIPGLWDMHCHFSLGPTYSSPLMIAQGVTGVRDMAADMEVVRKIRDRVQAGEILAPEIFAASRIIDGSPSTWPGSITVDSATEARQAVAEQIAAGVDCIKIYDQLGRDAFFAIAEMCRVESQPFVGHVPYDVGLEETITAGMHSFEHLFGLMEACTSRPQRLKAFQSGGRFNPARMEFLMRSFDRNRFKRIASRLADSQTWACPTLVFLKNAANIDQPELLDRGRLPFTPAFIRRSWNPRRDVRFQNLRSGDFETLRKYFRFQQRLIRDLVDAKVNILAGTNCPGSPGTWAGFSLHDDLQLLVEGGMTPAQALKTATLNPARFLKREDEIGQVKTGMRADMVLLEKNPLDRIENTVTIQAVVVRGRYLDRSALDELLKQARAAAAKARPPAIGR
jgi:imidazolonepropionase-like amidohydrolase